MTFYSSQGGVRPAAVAGQFYPDHADRLKADVSRHLAEATVVTREAPKVLIAPHAGYPYSGPVAGTAFTAWRAMRGRVKRVVLVGPSHYESFPGVAVTSARAFGTPLGEVPVDLGAVDQLLRRHLVVVDNLAHVPEHSLEVELPFLQVLLDEFEIVPLLVGVVDDEEVAEVIGELWGGDETGVVISSDLSHYHDYETAQELDRETARAVEALNPDPVDSQHACGWVAIQGCLRVARDRRFRARTLDLRNSGDTAGTRQRVVGYGAWLFEQETRA
jgi:MEMO1 family protein